MWPIKSLSANWSLAKTSAPCRKKKEKKEEEEAIVRERRREEKMEKANDNILKVHYDSSKVTYVQTSK